MSSNQWLRFLMFVIIVMNAKKYLWQKKNTNVLQNVFLFFFKDNVEMNKTFPCLAENATYFSTENALTITKAKFVTEYKKMSQMRKNNFKKICWRSPLWLFSKVKIAGNMFTENFTNVPWKKSFSKVLLSKKPTMQEKKFVVLAEDFPRNVLFSILNVDKKLELILSI